MHRASRREIRTPEMGELRATGRVADRLSARGVDTVASWEQACHNRERRGTTDGSTSHLARLNHTCDRLAGEAAERGRTTEIDYYGAMQPQQRYFPLFVNAFKLRPR